MNLKSRSLVLLLVMAFVTLLVGTVSAETVIPEPDPTNLTFTFPVNFTSCAPSPGTLTVTDLSSYHKVIFTVHLYLADGSTVQLYRSYQMPVEGQASFTFDYPALSEWPEGSRIRLQGSAEVYDISNPQVWRKVTQLTGTWKVICLQSCTPGYWKNHLSSWTGFLPDADFDTTFGTSYFDPSITLAEAATLGGGGTGKVARFGVASLLSAAHPGVGFAYTVEQVIALVQAGDGDALAAQFPDGGYECPLD